MKKFCKFIIVFSLMFFEIKVVKGYGVTCYYSNNESIIINVFSLQDRVQPEYDSPDFNYYFNKNNFTSIASEEVGSNTAISWLLNTKFLKEDNGKYFWTCPQTIEINDSDSVEITRTSFIESSAFFDIESSNDNWTCEYSHNSKKLIINYIGDGDIPKWNIIYPDGTNVTKNWNEFNATGNLFPNKDCEDIYYIPSKKIISSYVGGPNNATFLGLCRTYNDSDIEHYCSGNCNAPDMSCMSYYNTFKCGASTELPRALPIFTKNVVIVIKIIVPIMLIILGMLDFSKAVASNDEKIMNDSKNKFIKRIIGAVSIFLVVAVVQFIFSALSINGTNEMISCISCFIGNSCDTI